MQVSDYIVKKYGRTEFPRQILQDNKDPGEMSLPDLLSMILGSGTPYESVFSMSERLIKDYGSGWLMKQTDPKVMDDALRIGIANSCRLIACFEIGRRFFDQTSKRRTLIRGPEDIYNHCKDMRSLVKENFRCLYLNTRNYVIHDEVVSIGHLSGCLVHPREVFKVAIDCGANSVIVIHNHPSGEHEPSKADDDITKMLKEAGEIIQIPMTDHIIIAESGFYSYNKEERL